MKLPASIEHIHNRKLGHCGKPSNIEVRYSLGRDNEDPRRKCWFHMVSWGITCLFEIPRGDVWGSVIIRAADAAFEVDELRLQAQSNLKVGGLKLINSANWDFHAREQV